MDTGDPFQLLSFETAGNILYYLDPRSVIRCERVSTGWRDFIRAWIGSSGLSSNFPSQIKGDSKGDNKQIVQRFKDLGTHIIPLVRQVISATKTSAAAIEANLISGAPTAVRKVESRYELLVAGDFVAWHTDQDIHWQRLSFKEDGSVFPMHRLKCEPSPKRCDKFLLNADGYVLLAQISTQNQTQVTSVDVYSLEEGQKLYTIPSSELEDELTSKPVVLSKTRIYFASKYSLRVHDIWAGTLLHFVALADKPPILATDATRPTGCLRRIFTILTDGPRERILVLEGHWKSCTVRILDCESGSLLQKFSDPTWSVPNVILAPSQREFAIVSERNRDDTLSLMLHRFVRGADGLFHWSRAGIVVLDWKLTGSYLVALDPFRYLLALTGNRGIPEIFTLVNRAPNVSDGDASIEHSPTDQSTVPSVVDSLFHCGPAEEITLPPRYAHHKARRLDLIFWNWDFVVLTHALA
ncbi:hypothetical protein BJY01DRAFT_241871 [Aspergillus pseudoustus]|uniref:F-box domain-containing protein n=1 Tax=Aspergillus pseudoustus TaxID=1810923 RepID=A0ABR4L1Z4_9EURO